MRFEGGGLLGGLSGRGRPSHNGLLAQEASVMTLWEILCLHASPYKAVVWFLWEHPQGVGRGCKAAKAATTSLPRPRGDF